MRHGLSLPVCSDPGLWEEVEALVRQIAGTDANPKIQDLARRVAEAQIDLGRVRYARHQLLSRAMSDPYYDSRENVREKAAVMCRLLRGNAPHITQAAPVKYVTSTPQGPQKLGSVLI
jgi:hypothetical protein